MDSQGQDQATATDGRRAPDAQESVRKVISSYFPRLEMDEDVRWGVGLRVPPASLLEVARALKEMPGVTCDMLHNITGVDLKDHLQVVYHLTSSSSGAKVVLKVDLAPGEVDVDSVTSVWPAADWHEREAWDMVGIRFRTHPNLKRILLWEGYEGHPLRKDFVDRRPRRERLIRER